MAQWETMDPKKVMVLTIFFCISITGDKCTFLHGSKLPRNKLNMDI